MPRKNKSRWTKKTKIIVAVVVGLMIITAIVTPTEKEQKNGQTQIQATQPGKLRDPAELSVHVSHDDLNVIVQNNESKDLGNCKLKLNVDYIYDAKNRYLVNAGQEVKIGIANFTKKDGTRFNIYESKAQSLRIDCDRKDGDSGSADIFWD